jgi:serine phosphatase RsbU (regulator of sigma subunit)
MRTYSLANTHGHPALDYHAFCQCAHEYNGNFYDFIPQEGRSLAISFGDLPVTGDAQSIDVPCLHALVRGLTAGSGDDLAELAHELNRTLYLLGPRNLCVPWFYARIDPIRRTLQYVNAGHDPALLIRGHGAVERLERTGAALGLSTRGQHRQKLSAIDAGDLLAVFSEGLSEDAVLEVILRHSDAGVAELTERVRQAAGASCADDRSFAAARVLGACRRPVFEERAVESAMLCAA